MSSTSSLNSRQRLSRSPNPTQPNRRLNRFGPTALPRNSDSSKALLSSSDKKPLPKLLIPSNGPFEGDDGLDDDLHAISPVGYSSSKTDLLSWRGWFNVVGLLIVLFALVIIFAGYPIISFYTNSHSSFGGNTSGYNLGGINSTGQYPDRLKSTGLIDPDTPQDALVHKGDDGQDWDLVFSDEFNQDGRTFFDGDDPFFQAVDLHYWGTNDFEYYDPSAVTTKDGHLVITINQEPIHGLNFKSGMVQSWNKLCFHKAAYVEVSMSLPGSNAIGGFWPGVWTFANLGRPGYGATTDGTWPYSYDSCDIGILPNQTYADKSGPDAALGTDDGSPLSYLPGQRFSSCTCPNEPHPGPSHDIGRGVPEIDIIEAQILIDQAHGEVSQTYQVAPYDPNWKYDNSSQGALKVYDSSITQPNSYNGGQYQQSCSQLTVVPDDMYRESTGDSSGQFRVFGVEWASHPDKREEGYILWYSDDKKAWRLGGQGLKPNSVTEVGQRLISEEPMALVFNLGMSNNFQNVDFNHITLPNEFRIDYVRVYQNNDGVIGCDPPDRPTAKYIADHPEVYNNPNLTTWAAAGYDWPKNKLTSSC